MPAKHLPYPYTEPTAANLSSLEIEAIADRYAQEWGLSDKVSMDEVCTKAGVDIEYSRRPNEILLDVPIEAQPVIWLPRNARKRDDRVTISTGLGHWALHIEGTRVVKPGCGIQALYSPSAPEARREAEAFCLAFLMPRDQFIETWRKGKSQATSDHFDVPTKVTYLRATSLDLGDMA